MAEFRDLPASQGTVNERDAEIPEPFPNELLFDVSQNAELGENMLGEIGNRRIQEENNLVILTYELKNITTYLLKLQIKLIERKSKKVKEGRISCLGGLNDIIRAFQIIFNQIENIEDNQIQENSESITTAMRIIENLTKPYITVANCGDDEDLDEMRVDFLKYQEAYKKCALHVENFLQKSENNFKIGNVPRESQEDLCVLFTMLEENLPSYHTMLLSSKEEFETFELMLKNDMESSRQSSNNRFSLFIDAIKKAQLAYIKLKSIKIEILNFECAILVYF